MMTLFRTKRTIRVQRLNMHYSDRETNRPKGSIMVQGKVLSLPGG